MHKSEDVRPKYYTAFIGGQLFQGDSTTVAASLQTKGYEIMSISERQVVYRTPKSAKPQATA